MENNNKSIYVIKENVGGCKMCGRQEDLRFGWCFDCAEAQNIISCGRTMMEDDIETDIKFPIKQVNERLKMLIQNGWSQNKKYETPTVDGEPVGYKKK
jgi:hypothetical protein